MVILHRNPQFPDYSKLALCIWFHLKGTCLMTLIANTTREYRTPNRGQGQTKGLMANMKSESLLKHKNTAKGNII